jgi:small subunit ribosomal protein S17
MEKKLNKAVETSGKKMQGVVVSDKMDKTIVVSVTSVKIHPKYQKRFKRNKRYSVHDPENQYKEGDEVLFTPSKPFSKNKKWLVLGLTNKKS